MRPDRIIIGECRGAEAFDMLQAMNTGHEGSLTTIHANSARDALDRLAMLVGLAGSETPLWFVERQIASTVHVVVQLARLSGGVRKVVQIAEIQGWNGREVEMHDLFHYEQTGIEEDGLPRGTFHITGQVPKCLAKLRARGYLFSDDWFIRKCTTQGNRSDTHFPASSKASPDSNSLPLESAAPVSA